MTGRANHPLVGRWRIVSADIWPREHLDIAGPATLVITAGGFGSIDFGALTASLDIAYGSDEVGFTWNGADEGDQVCGDGSAEIQPDGSTNVVVPQSKLAIHTKPRTHDS